MNQVSTYSICRLQKALRLPTRRTDYFYVESDGAPIYTESPFRTDTYAILLLKKGCLVFQADLDSYTVKAPAVLTVGPNVTRRFQEVIDEVDLKVVFFTDSFLLETRANIFYLNNYRFFDDQHQHILMVNERELSRLNTVFDLIACTYNQDHANELVLMRSYSYLLIHEIDAIHRNRAVNAVRTEQQNPILVKFRNLLTKEFSRHRSLSFYADKLNTTSKYLSEVIKKHTGKTAGEWIEHTIILEAKVLLQNRELGIAQVSDLLNFSDQSVFGKFFKTHTGISPLEYRKRL